jgi:hypothetical protein
MARGSLKSDVLPNVRSKLDSGIKYIKDLDEKGTGALEDMRFALGNLYSALEAYQRGSDGTSDQQKWRKNQVVELVNKLPDELKAAVTMPKDFISKLYRGAAKPSSPYGADNRITASFTTNKKVASTFMFEANPMKEIPGGRKVYTKDDIQSFDGIINVNAINNLIKSYNKEAPKGSFLRYGKINMKEIAEKFSEEEEYLVYGIEWKDEYDGRVIS